MDTDTATVATIHVMDTTATADIQVTDTAATTTTTHTHDDMRDDTFDAKPGVGIDRRSQLPHRPLALKAAKVLSERSFVFGGAPETRWNFESKLCTKQSYCLILISKKGADRHPQHRQIEKPVAL
jgi:hypothetical protein